MNFFYFIVAEGIGFVVLKYAKWIKDNTGIRFNSMERFMGGGGTTFTIKIFGLAIMIFGFYALVNL